MFPVGSETHGFELNEEVIDHSSAQEKAFILKHFQTNLEIHRQQSIDQTTWRKLQMYEYSPVVFIAT